MPYWEELAQQMGSQAAGGIMGLFLGGINDQRQLRQQEKLQNLQIRGQKEMTDYGYSKQMQMWLDTNYKAQVDQMKLAGLNPGLLYGLKGGGGVTTGNATGNVTGGHAPVGGGEAMGIMGQIQLTMAQKNLMEAQARNLDADTANKPKVGANIEAHTMSLTQGVENQKAQKELIEVETSIKRIEDFVKGKTQNMAISIIASEAADAVERLGIIQNEHKISDATVQQQIEMVQAELIGIGLRNTLTSASTGATKAGTAQTLAMTPQLVAESQRKILNWVQQNMRDWDSMSHENRRIRVNEMLGQLAEEWAPLKAMSGTIERIVDGVIHATPGQKRNPVGYGR